MWTHPPTVKQGTDELLTNGGRGVVGEGVDRMPHLFASMVGGWHAISRGGVRGVVEYGLAIPPAAVMTYLGHVARPVLAPVALRAAPLPTAAKIAVTLAAVAVVAIVVALPVWLVTSIVG